MMFHSVQLTTHIFEREWNGVKKWKIHMKFGRQREKERQKNRLRVRNAMHTRFEREKYDVSIFETSRTTPTATATATTTTTKGVKKKTSPFKYFAHVWIIFELTQYAESLLCERECCEYAFTHVYSYFVYWMYSYSTHGNYWALIVAIAVVIVVDWFLLLRAPFHLSLFLVFTRTSAHCRVALVRAPTNEPANQPKKNDTYEK